MKRHLTCIAFLAFAISTFAQAQTETVLHCFASQPSDGNYADAGLIFDNAGNLYGTTVSGGAHYSLATRS